MLSKAQIKHIRSLHLKKYRDEEGLFIAEGKKIVEELLDSSIEVLQILVTDTNEALLASFRKAIKLQKDDIDTELVSIADTDLDKISALTTPQSVLAVCKIPKGISVHPNLKKELALALDDIRDPGNLGTIIRIADWFGINHIYCSEECVDAYNPKVVQASMGSIARVKVHYINLTEMLKSRAGENITIYGALLNGKNIYKENASATGILVIGNESNGISKEVQKYISSPISIPSYNANGPESLNAAIATAILCAELKRR
jgi:TrmH family RNA methyltransferase